MSREGSGLRLSLDSPACRRTPVARNRRKTLLVSVRIAVAHGACRHLLRERTATVTQRPCRIRRSRLHNISGDHQRARGFADRGCPFRLCSAHDRESPERPEIDEAPGALGQPGTFRNHLASAGGRTQASLPRTSRFRRPAPDWGRPSAESVAIHAFAARSVAQSIGRSLPLECGSTSASARPGHGVASRIA